MNRRDFIKYLLTTAAASTIDYEQLLWIPSQQIAVPTIYKPKLSDIIAIELERILPQMRTLFERDDVFYQAISERSVEIIDNKSMRLPLIIKPGQY